MRPFKLPQKKPETDRLPFFYRLIYALAMQLPNFHPAVSSAFFKLFSKPTPIQLQSWKAIQSGQHTLLAAPTGSGKTLAAFLAAIDTLVRESRRAPLQDATRVLYISPLKALSNDIHKNLQQPLQGINAALLERGDAFADITAAVRTGDTPPSERTRMRKTPPHILVTTPESLYILLTSASGREMLHTVTTIIIDEIHAVAGNKRGSHLCLSLERLEALCLQPPVRIGISATQKPIENMARFLVGQRNSPCTIIDTGHSRKRDLAIEITPSPLDAVMSNEVWGEIYDRLAALTTSHRTTLIFSNTRRMAERVARHLSERIGEEHVTSHHGSLSREHRLQAEQRLKAGQLKALIATASLELGIDIGDVDLVCQLGSPRSISGFLQRVGRSGHAVRATPKGRLFPLTRDDLVESVAILDAIEQGELDRIRIPDHPLDVLSQQVIAEVSAREWDERALLTHFRQAWPYRNLSNKAWRATLTMVAEGFTTRRGRRGAYIHWDRINGKLRPRRNARLTAIMNGGSIPDLFDYDVILEPQGIQVGTLNEDFSFESLPGDIFQLGNTAYRILKIEPGRMHVEDAQGLPPTIPFWFGESPGRSDELSVAVATLRRDISKQLSFGADHTRRWLIQERGLSPLAADQITDYLATAHAALGRLPDQENIIFERFFDEAGDMHFVIHSPYGSRLNRAWGLSLRKRFCRRFNFELQAAAVEDSIVLSLGATHSFPLEEVAEYLHPETVRQVLIQALLDAPMFTTHWRWNACTALAIVRNRNGRRVPAPFQRADAEDLVALIFPDQLACFENIAGEREVPEHPLVDQTLQDCLTDVMDIDGLEKLLRRIRAGEVKIHCRDLTGPSPLAREIINARPFAFLDDAPAEERRTLAIQNRSFASPEDANQLAKLDPAAIQQVRQEAWPEIRDAEELHDALVVYGFLTEEEGLRSLLNPDFFNQLGAQKRATLVTLADGASRLWFASERLHELKALTTRISLTPAIAPLESHLPDREIALRELLRSRLEALGPVDPDTLGRPLRLSTHDIQQGLLALEQEGFVVQGSFTGEHPVEWCERRLLARIHRYTLQTLRKEIKPVSPAAFMRFLFHWHGLDDPGEGLDTLQAVLQQLEGYSIAAAAWENDILPSRVRGYQPHHLDQLCSGGQTLWLHPHHSHDKRAAPLATTRIMLLSRANYRFWQATEATDNLENLGSTALRLYQQLDQGGAEFFFDLVRKTGLLRTQVEDALSELVANGRITSDTFTGLRALLTPSNKRPTFSPRRHRSQRHHAWRVDNAGRWSLLENSQQEIAPQEKLDHIAWVLLQRYGVVFRKVIEHEKGIPPWRELLRHYHRLEARGEIRGGRFIDSFSGEQFALPEAIKPLRARRDAPTATCYQRINGCDPLNLTGIITPGERIAARRTHQIIYRDGQPVTLIKDDGEMQALV